MNQCCQSCCCSCDVYRPLRCCSASQQNFGAFNPCSRSEGFSQEIEHVFGGKGKTGSLNSSRSSMKITSHRSAADSAFFLRPHLTREEYAYWSSHYSHYAPTCDNTTVSYSHIQPSCCARNENVLPPYRGERPHCCDRVVLGDNTCAGLCHNKAEFASKLEDDASRAVCERGNIIPCAHSRPYPKYANYDLENYKGCPLRSKESGSFKKESFHKSSVPPLRKQPSKGNYPSGSTKRSSYGVNQESEAAELRRKISERYLCGDQSFEDKSPALVTSKRAENSKTGRDPNVYHTMRSELGSSNKRKSTILSEHDNYRQGQCKRQRVGDEGIHQKRQASNNTIDLNDTLETFLNGTLPVVSCYGKEASLKINEAVGLRSMAKSPGLARTRVQGDQHAGKISSSVSFHSNHEPGSKSRKRNHPMIDPTDGFDDVAVKSRVLHVEDMAPNKRKDVDELIKTAKPVQRKLLKDSKSSLNGSYALDYDALPKLISVLSPPMAKVASTLEA